MMKCGLKDDNLDAYQIWQTVFHKQQDNSASSFISASAVSTSVADPADSTSSSSSSSSLSDLQQQQHNQQTGFLNAMSVMLDHGDPSLVIQGIYENMHKIYSYDTHNIARHAYSTEWLSISNLFSSAVYSGNGGGKRATLFAF
jgi:hypothetical protein